MCYKMCLNPLAPSNRFCRASVFPANSEGELWQKLEMLLHNVNVQLASHLDVLYFVESVEFSSRSISSQCRSICVFGVYI